jgi:hypothetical protein
MLLPQFLAQQGHGFEGDVGAPPPAPRVSSIRWFSALPTLLVFFLGLRWI